MAFLENSLKLLIRAPALLKRLHTSLASLDEEKISLVSLMDFGFLAVGSPNCVCMRLNGSCWEQCLHFRCDFPPRTGSARRLQSKKTMLLTFPPTLSSSHLHSPFQQMAFLIQERAKPASLSHTLQTRLCEGMVVVGGAGGTEWQNYKKR